MPNLKLFRCTLAALGASAVLAGTAAAATPGAVDTSFGKNGFATALVGTYSASVASAVQSNGDVVSAGVATVAGTNEMLVTRTNGSGQADTSFGTRGATVIPIGKMAGADAIAIQPNGDIVVAGMGRDPVTTTIALAAARLTPSGQLDQTFGSGGITTVPVGSEAIANGVAIEPNGYIVLGGMASTDTKHFVAALLTPTGAIDTAFGNGGTTVLSPEAAAWGVGVQSDGDIVLGGEETYNGGEAYMAAELTPAGAPDSTFGGSGIVTVPIGSTAVGLAMAVQPNGDVLVSGNAVTSTRVVATIRLLPDGALDPTFGSGGIATFAGLGINAMALQSSGDILLAGSGPSAVRLLANGTMDTSFGRRGFATAPIGTKGSANGVTVQPDGNIVLTGATKLATAVEQVVVRLFG